MNSKQIDCAIELAKTLNFNRAAENLFISQPALSYQIRSLEEEVGFQLFERSGRGAVLTLAGQQFCQHLTQMKRELEQAIDSCRNLNQSYQDVIRIFLPTRSALYFLTDAIEEFSRRHPQVFIDVTIDLNPNNYQAFLQGSFDILYGLKSSLTKQPEIQLHPLYDSQLYLVSNFDDPLAQLEKVSMDDLEGRSLIVGQASPKELAQVQHRILDRYKLTTLTSANHETTLTNIRAKRGICIVPGLLNDFNDEFAWTPFDCPEVIPCVLCTHKNHSKPLVTEFVQLLQSYYEKNETVPT